ncbi:MAG TPA: hypothetical protein G4N96_06595 [Chloroflexi bacterium]|nr:hypothetical protein [Chloroflexota bacterium]
MKHEGDWWLGGFLVAFIAGMALTLFYTWVLVPQAPHTTPAQLNPADKEIYILLIAAAYRHDGDLDKAKKRLSRLEDAEIAQNVADLSTQYISKGADARDIRSLVTLADGLETSDSSMLVYLITPTPTPSPPPTLTPPPSATSVPTASATPTVSPTPKPTNTRIPTAIPTLTPTVNPTITPRPTFTPGPNAPFGLAQSVALCDNTGNGILRVYVRDWQGKGLPGAKITVSWPGGEDKFYSGFKSAANPGYADFEMTSEQIYQVELEGSPVAVAKDVNKNARALCSNLPDKIAPSWQIVFQQGAGNN